MSKTKKATQPTLKEKYINLIMADTILMGTIASKMGKKNFRTIERWCKDKHQNLTLPTVLKLIADKAGVEQSELLTAA